MQVYLVFKHNNPLIAAVSLLLLSCNSGGTKKQDQEKNTFTGKDSIPALYSKPSSSYNDTIIIKGKAAVFFRPDSVQLKKISTVRSKMDFESDNHDCFFQMQNARVIIKKHWPQVKIIETSAARYLLFIHSDQSRSVIDLNEKNDMCGIFLFNGIKKPELTDMMNIDTGLAYYFGQ